VRKKTQNWYRSRKQPPCGSTPDKYNYGPAAVLKNALDWELDVVGCDLYLHQQALDTTTPAGRALFQMLDVFAEFERESLRSRVKAGLARARVHGAKSGKPIGQQPLAAQGRADPRRTTEGDRHRLWCK